MILATSVACVSVAAVASASGDDDDDARRPTRGIIDTTETKSANTAESRGYINFFLFSPNVIGMKCNCRYHVRYSLNLTDALPPLVSFDSLPNRT